MATNDEMREALKSHFIPRLRDVGMKGGFPHFYRDDDGFVCLLNIQFNRAGAAFCVNLGFADEERKSVVAHCRDRRPAKLRVSMTGALIEDENYLSGRFRLGGKPLEDGLQEDHWFTFQTSDADTIALECVDHFNQEAQIWWDGRRAFAKRARG